MSRPAGASLSDSPDVSFASDNTAGVSPEVLEALTAVNAGHQAPYGDDPVTARLSAWAQEEFGPQAEIFPVFNGTGANVLALQAMLPRWGAAVCAQTAHVATDEGGAPERLGGVKLLPRPSPEGKLTPEDLDGEAGALKFVHAAQPLAVTLTQSTELGTLYTPGEIAAVAERAHSLGMGVHMDGARIANAAAALGVSLRELTAEAGVDVLSLGATKNGALAAEAVVVLDPEQVHGLEYLRKSSMHLASKQRFLSAQLLTLFDGDLWHRNAAHANAQAGRLAQQLEGIEGVSLSRPTRVNVLFPEMPAPVARAIQQLYLLHTWETTPRGNPVLRLMCSWQTTQEEADKLVAHVRAAADDARRA